jgi:hypothetical protein
VRWEPDIDALGAIIKTDGSDSAASIPSGPFRFLVVRRKGSWLVGGMLPPATENTYQTGD